MINADDNIRLFIEHERKYFEHLNTGIDWDKPIWINASKDWLYSRSKPTSLPFTCLSKRSKAGHNSIVAEGELPEQYMSFCKAMIVYLQRTRNCGFSMTNAYLIMLRRLYNCLFRRNDISPSLLTRSDFDHVIEGLKQSNYKNLYDAASHLKAVAEVIDSKHLTQVPIYFEIEIKIKQASSRHDYISQHDPDVFEKERNNEEKLPSREAMEAYAICTNNPINDNEEILLRVIDLLIATGQRGNEIAYIPFDCWVENPKKDSSGNIVVDAHGKPIVETGIRYYAEKQFQSRVHWLATQDIPLAKRAVERLKIITQKARNVAKFQECNPNNIWEYDPEYEIMDEEIFEHLSFASLRNMRLFLMRNNIKPIREKLLGKSRNAGVFQYYRAGDIEELLIPKLNDHISLKEKVDGKWTVRLKTSEVLAIAFDGSFRFNGRQANTMSVFPRTVNLADINRALGADSKYPSIFDRRSLTEADGTRIQLTSHKPRHWRNTIYRLTGMSDVQQALALGRQDLTQNAAYQHTNRKEDTDIHREFLIHGSLKDKLSYFHDAVRNRNIFGSITDTYHSIKETQDMESAEEFLKVHARAIHITPYGGCTHDFSQLPCRKHLQCWNNCSHLHRTTNSDEEKQLNIQIDLLQKSIITMKQYASGEAGSDVWIQNEEKKLRHMQKSLLLENIDETVQVFTNGIAITESTSEQRHSSVDTDTFGE